MKTALYERHVALGGKIVPFAGWEMPVQYKGVVAEHLAVRQAVGLFDVSHMGRIKVEGVEAERFLNYISTNRIDDHPNGSAIYTVWCHANGHCIDDVIIYKENSENFWVVVNAGNREKDLKHLHEQVKTFQAYVRDHFESDAILALQGPKADELLSQLFPECHEIKPMHFILKNEIMIARTGYTGAGGFEIAGAQEKIVQLWDQLLEKGKPFGIMPVGLGARDTLRLEMGFALYGHEISDEIAVNESVASWTIKGEKDFFLGKDALEILEKSGKKRAEYGIKLIEKMGIPRQGNPIFLNEKQIGEVTSGTFSPSLNEPIAIILVMAELKVGDRVQVKIRQQSVAAEIVKLPFIRKER